MVVLGDAPAAMIPADCASLLGSARQTPNVQTAPDPKLVGRDSRPARIDDVVREGHVGRHAVEAAAKLGVPTGTVS